MSDRTFDPEIYNLRRLRRVYSADVRFEESYIPEPNSGCWLWLGGPQGQNGYGAVKTDDRQKVFAHRYAWEQVNGPVPPGLLILHSCDVPLCVNPDHLFVGTHLDNAKDRNRKGRQAQGERLSQAQKASQTRCGENNHLAKLTWEIVAEIRAAGESQRALARRYGVAQSTINSIKLRRTWA